jgi:hypothetical protein
MAVINDGTAGDWSNVDFATAQNLLSDEPIAPGGHAEAVLEDLTSDPEAPNAPDLVEAFLAGRGLDYSTATPEERFAAAQEADEWQAKALGQLDASAVAQVDAESHALSVGLENTLNEFVNEHANGSFETAEPFIDLAFKAMEDGTGFYDAMQQAADAIGRMNTADDIATREVVGQQLGYAEGMKAGFARLRAAKDHTPKQKYVPAQPNHANNLGSTATSEVQMSNAIARFAANQRAKAELKTLAHDRVRNAPPVL